MLDDKEMTTLGLDSPGHPPEGGTEEDWNRLRGLSAQDAAEHATATRHRRVLLVVLLGLVTAFALLMRTPLILPDSVLNSIATNVEGAVETVFPSAEEATVPVSDSGEAEPAQKTSRRSPRGSAQAASTAGQQQPAPQNPPFAGGVNVVTQDPTKPPFGVEIVDNRDRRFTPTPGERVINLAEQGTMQRAEVDPHVSERMRITPGPVISRPGSATGVVKLRAVVGTDGNIKELAVVSGPSELGPAAVQVARQWRYKPYYFNGRPIETETYITINFSISTN